MGLCSRLKPVDLSQNTSIGSVLLRCNLDIVFGLFIEGYFLHGFYCQLLVHRDITLSRVILVLPLKTLTNKHNVVCVFRADSKVLLQGGNDLVLKLLTSGEAKVINMQTYNA